MSVTNTDGSSDKSLNKGGDGVFFAHPDGSIHKHRINTGMIASNFTSELLAIKETLTIYLTDLRMLGSTEGLVVFSDSNSALQAIRNGEYNITSAINNLLKRLEHEGKSCNGH
ncbi:hypothetical protein NPIL_419461 [Nephila pilipes]|uniref:RNase H type-1 domain-containing protein n=1 Tax=Nephila pilipes TaxID=299642 RepID=A0A8X6QXE7_NEPPI|nr:hypothetical protein NPIL_419461 [Nephila pilipes]